MKHSNRYDDYDLQIAISLYDPNVLNDRTVRVIGRNFFQNSYHSSSMQMSDVYQYPRYILVSLSSPICTILHSAEWRPSSCIRDR